MGLWQTGGNISSCTDLDMCHYIRIISEPVQTPMDSFSCANTGKIANRPSKTILCFVFVFILSSCLLWSDIVYHFNKINDCRGQTGLNCMIISHTGRLRTALTLLSWQTQMSTNWRTHSNVVVATLWNISIWTTTTFNFPIFKENF